MAKKQTGKQRGKGPSTKRRQSGGSAFIAVVVGIALVFVLVLALVHKPTATSPTAAAPAKAPAKVVAQLASVPLATFNTVGATGAAKPILVPPAPITGKVQFLYVGAEYCPYCAAARWPMIVALSRFGTFSNLHLMRSISTDRYPNTPTFTFYGASYKSPYVNFQPVETAKDQFKNGAPVPLQQMSPAVLALVQKFDAAPYVPGSTSGDIPFVLIGHRYLFAGAPYLPSTIDGQTWPQISGQLAKGTTAAAKAIITNANELTAAICSLDGGQPANVCGSLGVSSAKPTLSGTVP